jgi:uncharacterized protein YndB with AHSA1/START domain
MTSQNNNESNGNFADREIVISRVFDAPRQLVWQAMTDPAQVVKWWGPRGFTTTIEEMNVKPGGIWKHVMHGPDGTDYPNKSIFTDVVELERLVYTHFGCRVGGPSVQFVSTWTFDALEDNKTRLTLRHVFATAEERDKVVKEFGAIEGGKQTMARLAEQLAQAPLVVERTFHAPVDLVWKALTNPDDIREWSFSVTDFKPEVGFEFQFSAQKDNVTFLHLCKVTDAVPCKKLAYTWRYEGYPGESLVTIELSADGERTKLRLTHEGLETFQPEKNPELARGNFVQGWTAIIGTHLKEFVEKSSKPA